MTDPNYVVCMTCLEPFDVNDPSAFNDELSRREFSISGMCQACQDSTFGGIGEEEDFDEFEEDIEWEDEEMDVNDFKEEKDE